MNRIDELLNLRQSLERQQENVRNSDSDIDHEIDRIDAELAELRESGRAVAVVTKKCAFPTILNCGNCPVVKSCRLECKAIL